MEPITYATNKIKVFFLTVTKIHLYFSLLLVRSYSNFNLRLG